MLFSHEILFQTRGKNQRISFGRTLRPHVHLLWTDNFTVLLAKYCVEIWIARQLLQRFFERKFHRSLDEKTSKHFCKNDYFICCNIPVSIHWMNQLFSWWWCFFLRYLYCIDLLYHRCIIGFVFFSFLAFSEFHMDLSTYRRIVLYFFSDLFVLFCTCIHEPNTTSSFLFHLQFYFFFFFRIQWRGE